MLDHNQRIAQIPQPFQGCNQFIIVPLMQANARLIQNIQNAHQIRANLRCQTNPLTFSAGERASCSGERQVFQPDIFQETQPFPDFFQNLRGNLLFLLR